jgi:hypothetical protein
VAAAVKRQREVASRARAAPLRAARRGVGRGREQGCGAGLACRDRRTVGSRGAGPKEEERRERKEGKKEKEKRRKEKEKGKCEKRKIRKKGRGK